MLENNPRNQDSPTRDRAQALGRFFPGREDAYGLQQPYGSYVAVRKTLTLSLLEAHCRGKLTVGEYLLTPQGKVRFGVGDIDQDSPGSRGAVVYVHRCLAHFNIPSVIEPSGRKGFHLLIPFADFIPASKARRLLLGALRALPDECRGLAVEVFPKHEKAGDLGSLIKLPWGCFTQSSFPSQICGGPR